MPAGPAVLIKTRGMLNIPAPTTAFIPKTTAKGRESPFGLSKFDSIYTILVIILKYDKNNVIITA